MLLVVASNRPYDIDSAFLRRFEIMIEIPIPTLEDKLEHINKWIKSKCDKKIDDRTVTTTSYG